MSAIVIGMQKPYGVNDTPSVMLDIPPIIKLPEKIELKGHTLYVKDEFHITLLNVKFLAEIINPTNYETIKNQLLQEFDDFIQTHSLANYTVTNELRFVQENDKKTLVVIAHVDNLDELFELLSQKFSVNLPRQVAHVTLYRHPKNFIGIPINSAEALRSISQPITVPAVESALARIKKIRVSPREDA